MIALQSDVRVYLACGYTDMRKGMQGLAMLVRPGCRPTKKGARARAALAAIKARRTYRGVTEPWGALGKVWRVPFFAWPALLSLSRAC